MIHFKKQTKALISLHGGVGWSASLLFRNPEDRFSPVQDYIVLEKKLKK